MRPVTTIGRQTDKWLDTYLHICGVNVGRQLNASGTWSKDLVSGSCRMKKIACDIFWLQASLGIWNETNCSQLSTTTTALSELDPGVQMSSYCLSLPAHPPCLRSGFWVWFLSPSLSSSKSIASSFVRFDLHRFFIIDFQLEGQSRGGKVWWNKKRVWQKTLRRQLKVIEEGIWRMRKGSKKVVELEGLVSSRRLMTIWWRLLHRFLN